MQELCIYYWEHYFRSRNYSLIDYKAKLLFISYPPHGISQILLTCYSTLQYKATVYNHMFRTKFRRLLCVPNCWLKSAIYNAVIHYHTHTHTPSSSCSIVTVINVIINAYKPTSASFNRCESYLHQLCSWRAYSKNNKQFLVLLIVKIKKNFDKMAHTLPM